MPVCTVVTCHDACCNRVSTFVSHAFPENDRAPRPKTVGISFLFSATFGIFVYLGRGSGDRVALAV